MSSSVTELSRGATTEQLNALASAPPTDRSWAGDHFLGFGSDATFSASPVAGQWILDVRKKVAGSGHGKATNTIKIRVQFGLSPDGRSYVGTAKARMAVGLTASWLLLALIALAGIAEINSSGVVLLAIAAVISLWLAYYIRKTIPKYERDGATQAFRILDDHLTMTPEQIDAAHAHRATDKQEMLRDPQGYQAALRDRIEAIRKELPPTD